MLKYIFLEKLKASNFKIVKYIIVHIDAILINLSTKTKTPLKRR